MMTLSVHDNLLVSYEVQCEKRVITLRTEFREKSKTKEFTNVVFKGVEAYHFQGDAFGNIIFDVAEFPTEQLLKDFGSEVSELYRYNARPEWASNLASAPEHLESEGIKGFVLSSSYGLGGWILAKEMSIIAVD